MAVDRGSVPHPFPYQGSKRKLASSIVRCIPGDCSRLVEPFAGSAAVSVACASARKSRSYLLNDADEALVSLWGMILHDPSHLTDEYERLWKEQLGQERTFFDFVRRRFNAERRPSDLLYLLARCVKAAVRYNARGEFNNSPDNRRRGMRPRTMRRNIEGVSRLLADRTELSARDYVDVLDRLDESAVVYLDPPYQGVSGSRDPRYRGGEDFDRLVGALEGLDRRRIRYLLSYDGRTGAKTHGRQLPDHLRCVRFELEAGRSAQATLLGKNDRTYESLYVAESLLECLPGRVAVSGRDPSK